MKQINLKHGARIISEMIAKSKNSRAIAIVTVLLTVICLLANASGALAECAMYDVGRFHHNYYSVENANTFNAENINDINLGIPFSGYLASTQQCDYYHIRISQTGRYRFALSGVYNSYIRLIAYSSSSFSSSAQISGIWRWQINDELVKTWTIDLEAGKEYWFAVSLDSQYTATPTNYSLNMTLFKKGTLTSRATTLQWGNTYNNEISCGDDFQVYVLNTGKGSQFDITTTASKPFSRCIEIRNENWTEIEHIKDIKDNSKTNTLNLMPERTYYIVIQGHDHTNWYPQIRFTSGKFTLSVSCKDAVNDAITFTMNPTTVKPGYAHYVEFDVRSDYAKEVRVLVTDKNNTQGFTKPSHNVSSGRAAFRESFHVSGERIVQIQGRKVGEDSWSLISEPQILTVEDATLMQALRYTNLVDNKATAPVGKDFEIRWENPSTLPCKTSIYVYSSGSDEYIYNKEVSVFSHSIPSAIFSTKGIYNVDIYAIGESRQQSPGTRAVITVTDEAPPATELSLKFSPNPTNPGYANPVVFTVSGATGYSKARIRVDGEYISGEFDLTNGAGTLRWALHRSGRRSIILELFSGESWLYGDWVDSGLPVQTLVVNSVGKYSKPSIIAPVANPVNLALGESLTVRWDLYSGANKTSVYVYDGSNKQVAVNKDMSVAYYQIGPDILSKAGSYRIDLYATGDSLEQSDAESVNIVVGESGKVPVTGIALDESTLNLTVGQTVWLPNVIFTPANATDKAVSWSSSNRMVADIEFFKVTAVAPGTATITATAQDGGYTATCVVTVTEGSDPTDVPVTGITLDRNRIDIYPGNTATLTATVAPANASDKTVVWSIEDTSIATVNAGVVTAISPGTTLLTATTQDGSYIAACIVAVLEGDADIPVTGIEMDRDKPFKLKKGVETTIYVDVIPNSFASQVQISYSTSKKKIVRITDYGIDDFGRHYVNVLAKKTGKSIITADCYYIDGDGMQYVASDSVRIKVVKK